MPDLELLRGGEKVVEVVGVHGDLPLVHELEQGGHVLVCENWERCALLKLGF